jgi:hypothetical protein
MKPYFLYHLLVFFGACTIEIQPCFANHPTTMTPLTGRAMSKSLDKIPVATSYDGKWIVKGFEILNRERKVVFKWNDAEVYPNQKSVTVSWSPDSSRVIILQQLGRDAMFFAAELTPKNQWKNVHTVLQPLQNPGKSGQRLVSDPRTPSEAEVTREELLEWVSPTMIRLKETHNYYDESHNWKQMTYTTTYEFTKEGGRYAK